MKFWAVALVVLAGSWCGSAQAAISADCRVMANIAHSANLQARGGFVSQFETRAAPVDEKEHQQRLADAADAVLLVEASRVACTGADAAAPLAALTNDVAPHLAAINAALAEDDCLPVLATVQNRLLGLAQGLERGTATPEMQFVLTGTMALNTKVGAQCKGDGTQIVPKFAEQGEALRGLYTTVSVCGPAQYAYHQILEKAAGSVANISREDYAVFLRDTYDPALTKLRAACGEILKTDVIDANDKRMRDYDMLKADAARAVQTTPAVP